jgi:hypothetical protein
MRKCRSNARFQAAGAYNNNNNNRNYITKTTSSFHFSFFFSPSFRYITTREKIGFATQKAAKGV